MKKITLTEKQLEEMVLKALTEQGAVAGGAAGMNRSQMNSLTECSRVKNPDSLVGGIVRKYEVADSRLKAFQAAANSMNTGTSLYLEVNRKPFCKLR